MKETKEMNETKVLTTKQLCSVLQIGRDKAYALVKSKGFPSVCIGNRYFVTEKALNEWLERYQYKTYEM